MTRKSNWWTNTHYSGLPLSGYFQKRSILRIYLNSPDYGRSLVTQFFIEGLITDVGNCLLFLDFVKSSKTPHKFHTGPWSIPSWNKVYLSVVTTIFNIIFVRSFALFYSSYPVQKYFYRWKKCDEETTGLYFL